MTALLAILILGQVQVRQEPKDWNLLKTEHFAGRLSPSS